MSYEQAISKPAGFWIRFGAYLIDAIPFSILAYLFMGNLAVSNLFSLLYLLYAIILPLVWNGQTIGKKVVGIRIVKLNGEPVTLGTMLLRVIVGNLIYVISFGIAFIVSAFMVGQRADKRSIHDFVAGTYVTNEKA